MPSGTTAREFQRRLNGYALAGGQRYDVDASRFDPAGGANYFDFLTVDQCRKLREAKLTDHPGGRIYNHYQVCAWREPRLYLEEPKKFLGQLLGFKVDHIDFRLTLLGYGSDGTSQMDMYAYVDKVTSDNGKLKPTNTALTLRGVCGEVYGDGECSHSTVQSNWFSNLETGQYLTLTTNASLGPPTTGNLDAKFAFLLKHSISARSTAAPNAAVVVDFSQMVRCDNATRGGFTGPACIYADVIPSWRLNVNEEAVKGVAVHIRDALSYPNDTKPPPDSGQSKIIPSLLSRLTDQTIIDLQRHTATQECPKWWGPRPDGHQCDEYPFASTHEGSWSSEHQFSVKWVVGLQNETEGGRRGTWYIKDRILEEDQFLVGTYDGPPG